MPRRVLEYVLGLLDVDRRASRGMERYERDWPVTLAVPVSPVEYDAVRFLASMYPANVPEIARACVLPFLDEGSKPPGALSGVSDLERTARLELCLEEGEAARLESLSAAAGAGPEQYARWAILDSLGPLLHAHRPR